MKIKNFKVKISYLLITLLYITLLYSYKGVLLYNTDVAFLVNRARNMLVCLQDGNVPWFYYNDLYGVGYGSSFFYGQLTIYPFLPLLLISDSVFVVAYYITALLIEIIGVREFCKRFTTNFDFITILYFCCTLTVFTSGVFKMFANVLGLGLGFLFLAFCVDFFRDKKSFLPSSILFYLLLNTHLITTLICFSISVLLFIYYKGYKNITEMIKFFITTTTLCCYNIANFLYHKDSLADTVAINQNILTDDNRLSAYTLKVIPCGDVIQYIITGKYNGLSLCSIVLFCTIFFLIAKKFKIFSIKLKMVTTACVALLLLSIKNVWGFINLNIYTFRMQFPIRYLPFILLVLLLLAFSSGISIKFKLYTLLYNFMYSFVLICLINGFVGNTFLPSSINSTEGMIGNGEYLSKNFYYSEYELYTRSKILYDDNNNQYVYDISKGVLTFDINTTEDTVVYIPKLFYKGYVAYLDDTSLYIYEGQSQFAEIMVPENSSGVVTVFYKHPSRLKILDLICLVIFIQLCLQIFFTQYCRRSKLNV